jgi:hypothetical protein
LLVIDEAAHGVVGSSSYVFGTLASTIVRLLDARMDLSDTALLAAVLESES